MQTKPQQSTLQPQQTENVQTTTKKTITTHATTAAAEKTSMVPITMKTTTGKITATATITKALQARPRPTEPTPSMVKNQKLFLNSLPISEGAALGTAELLYQLGIDELTEVAVIPDGAWGYTVDAKEADGTAYLLVLSEYGYLSRVYMKGMWDTPLYAS